MAIGRVLGRRRRRRAEEEEEKEEEEGRRQKEGGRHDVEKEGRPMRERHVHAALPFSRDCYANETRQSEYSLLSFHFFFHRGLLDRRLPLLLGFVTGINRLVSA